MRFPRSIPAALAVLAMIAGPLPAAGPDWSLSLEERLVSDSHILRLSPSDLDRLNSSPSFQTDVGGAAAMRLEHRLSARLRQPLKKNGLWARLQRFTGGRPGRGRLELAYYGKLAQYEHSSAKDYGSHRLTLGWRPRAGWGLDLSYRFLQNFYLRQYTDRDTGVVRGCGFDGNEFRLRARVRWPDPAPWLTRFGTEFLLLREDVYYNGWFTEYDTRAWSAGLYLSADLPAGLGCELGYRLAVTDNIGYRRAAALQSGSALLDADEAGDAGHQEDRYSLSLGRRFRLAGRRLDLDLDLVLRDRYYSSDLGAIEDPYHYGRRDMRWLEVLRGSWRAAERLSLVPVIEREWRRSTAIYADLDRVKNYAAWRAGLGFHWRIK